MQNQGGRKTLSLQMRKLPASWTTSDSQSVTWENEPFKGCFQYKTISWNKVIIPSHFKFYNSY